MDFSLCFCDGSLMPFTLIWKVAGIDVFNVNPSVVVVGFGAAVVAVVGFDAGNCWLDGELFD